ncbi:MAG: hypothetical protein IJB64_00165 [Akkermansia sp.]|nr:hypothetical protein [Akkermansia sp.]
METLADIWTWILNILKAADLLPHFDSAVGIFCTIAWAATLISLVMFIGSAVADVADGADAADAAGDVDGDAGMFSTRAIIAFILGFGWGGYLTVVNGSGVGMGITVGLLLGVLMFVLVAALMKFIYSLKSDGSLKYETLVGMTGTVYVTIPPHGEPGGQVQVSHPSQLITMAAIQEGDTPLPAQTRIEVVHATTYQLTVRPIGTDSK